MDLEQIKQREKAYHERFRSGVQPLARLDVETIRARWLAPTWAGGIDRYNDTRAEFHRFLEQQGGFEGRRILDYCCGNGTWSLYFRLRGAAHVVGFDIAETGVRRGMARLEAQGEAHAVQLVCADATRMPLRDASFDMVIGTAVLHHVIKYPGIFEELHRVLVPGGRAYFLEGLADAPLFKLWWRLKGDVEEGDVPIFAADLRRRAAQFASVQVTGMHCFQALTHFLFRQPLGGWRRAVLRATDAADRALFRLLPAARRWGAFSIIVLEKGAATEDGRCPK